VLHGATVLHGLDNRALLDNRATVRPARRENGPGRPHSHAGVTGR
jgi:hypothetical protein